jgi:hypothetical protein
LLPALLAIALVAGAKGDRLSGEPGSLITFLSMLAGGEREMKSSLIAQTKAIMDKAGYGHGRNFRALFQPVKSEDEK